MNPKRLQLLLLIFSGLICFSIFNFSNQPAKDSKQVSHSITKKVVESLPWAQKLSEPEKEKLIQDIHSPIRKAAHFTLYFLLGMSITGFFVLQFTSLKQAVFLAALFCLFYGVLDEVHQIFVPGRSGEIRDVLIDFLGGLAGSLLMALLMKIKRKKPL